VVEQRRVDSDPLELNNADDDRPPGLFAQEGVRSSAIAVLSTVIVFGGAAILIARSPNWPKVRDQYFNGEDFRASAPDVLDGFWVNLELFGYATVSVAIVALIIAVMRSFRGPAFFPIRALATLYTDIFRGVPLILLILLIGFGLPALNIPGVPVSAKFWGIFALTLSYSAYTAEIYRSGIDAVSESQRSAARSLGLTQWQSMRYAILPQAVRNVVPALMNTVVSLQKDVALLSILGSVREAVREAQIYTAKTFNYTSYVVATLLFLLISIPLTRLVDWYTERDRKLRSQAPV
jgi:polar amino acid transport system permease protein